MAGVVTINLGKLDDLRAELAKGWVAKVGILSDSSHLGDKGRTIGMVELGTIHEFGSLSRNIPPRSFLRMPLEKKRDEIISFLKSKVIADAIETGNIKKAIALLGVKAESIVQEAFATRGFGLWPALKQATIKRKGSDSPLIDTGALRRSITSEVVKK